MIAEAQLLQQQPSCNAGRRGMRMEMYMRRTAPQGPGCRTTERRLGIFEVQLRSSTVGEDARLEGAVVVLGWMHGPAFYWVLCNHNHTTRSNMFSSPCTIGTRRLGQSQLLEQAGMAHAKMIDFHMT